MSSVLSSDRMRRDRIHIYVDGANFFYMQKDVLGWWIDPRKIMDWAALIGDVNQAYYYVAVVPEGKQIRQAEEKGVGNEKYLRALQHMKYTVVTAPVREKVDQDDPEKRVIRTANFDASLTTDLIMEIDQYDIAILVSGSASFAYPLMKVKACRKRFFVLSTAGMIGDELRAMSGLNFIDFNSIKNDVEKENGNRTPRQPALVTE